MPWLVVCEYIVLYGGYNMEAGVGDSCSYSVFTQKVKRKDYFTQLTLFLLLILGPKFIEGCYP